MLNFIYTMKAFSFGSRYFLKMIINFVPELKPCRQGASYETRLFFRDPIIAMKAFFRNAPET